MKNIKQKILILDDDNISSILLVGILTKTIGADFEYVTVNSAKKAEEILENDLKNNNSLPCLIISDWLMPDCRGDEFLQSIFLKYNSIPLVLYSSFHEPEIIATLEKSCKLVCFLHKPWNGVTQIELIKNAIFNVVNS